METTISILKQTYEVMAGAVSSAAPKLLATAIVVVLGLIVARAAKALLHRLLDAVQFEDVAAKIGLSNALERAEVTLSASGIVCTFVYWTFLAFTGLAALGTLGFADSGTFVAIGSMIPNVVVAVAILVLGLNVATFLSKLIQTTAVNAEVRQARLVRNVAYYGMGTLVVILAVGQLGVPTEILTTGFYIFFAGSCLAMALAFGLGSRDLAAGIAKDTWRTEKEQSRTLSEASDLGDTMFPTHASHKRSRRKAAA